MILRKQMRCLVKPASLRADLLHELGQLGHHPENQYRDVEVFIVADGGSEGS